MVKVQPPFNFSDEIIILNLGSVVTASPMGGTSFISDKGLIYLWYFIYQVWRLYLFVAHQASEVKAVPICGTSFISGEGLTYGRHLVHQSLYDIAQHGGGKGIITTKAQCLQHHHMASVFQYAHKQLVVEFYTRTASLEGETHSQLLHTGLKHKSPICMYIYMLKAGSQFSQLYTSQTTANTTKPKQSIISTYLNIYFSPIYVKWERYC